PAVIHDSLRLTHSLKTHAKNRRHSDGLFAAVIFPADFIEDRLNLDIVVSFPSSYVRFRGSDRTDFGREQIVHAAAGRAINHLEGKMLVDPGRSHSRRVNYFKDGVHSYVAVGIHRYTAFARIE